MNPDVTLRELVDAALEQDPATLQDAAADLVGWFRADGFPPSVQKLHSYLESSYAGRGLPLAPPATRYTEDEKAAFGVTDEDLHRG